MKTNRLETNRVDFIVLGAGIAGLRAAIELARHGRVLVFAKGRLDDSATCKAQGGIAVALGEDDSFELHAQDTLAAGAGLCDPLAVRTLVSEGPAAVRELLAWGAQFDQIGPEESPAASVAGNDAVKLSRTREAAHSRARILHAHGDSTGREIARALLAYARAQTSIRWLPGMHCLRLLTAESHAGRRCLGAEFLEGKHQRVDRWLARAVLVSTGGLGQLFLDTTNPELATGDGAVLAGLAGAELADLEMVQFHPTVLALEGAPRFLLSEALRGEGALLRNPAGERFMPRYHPLAELAPRDVVARAVEAEAQAAGPNAVCWLDITHIPRSQLARRFPGIYAACRGYGLNLANDWIPIRPAAHYAMGGVRTDLDGRSSLEGCFAAGEAACTGVHGANRLASNSLLEGLVFGRRAARAMSALPMPDARPENLPEAGAAPLENVAEALCQELRRRMWATAGVARDEPSLTGTLEWLRAQLPPVLGPRDFGAAQLRWRSLAILAQPLLKAAHARQESRGAHYRRDFPQAQPQWDGCHSLQVLGGPVRFAPLPDRALRQAS